MRQLSIGGLAVVKELSLEFGGRLNVLTGETGAGKSIIVGAIGLLVGGRATGEVVRTGEKAARITGVFDVGPRSGVLREMEASGLARQEDEVIVKREISADGRSRAYVNGEPVTMTLLKRLGELLVDFHGQHEHQSLLRKEAHVELLDAFGALGKLRDEVLRTCAGLRDLKSSLEKLLVEQREARAQGDFMRFQVSEIDSSRLEEGEEERLREERTLLTNFERLASSLKDATNLLSEDELSCVRRLSKAVRALGVAASVDQRLAPFEAELSSAEITLADVGRSLAAHLSTLEFTPGRLDEVETRLDAIARLRRKHGGDVAAILRLAEKLRERLQLAEGGSETEAALRSEIDETFRELSEAATLLVEKRRSTAARLEKEVQKELSLLGMRGTRFIVRMEFSEDDGGDVEFEGKRIRIGANGPGDVQFLIAPNVGEEPRPLVRIASGGEISRIMLALKTVLARQDEVDVLVFDEVDVGIGGKIARVVGEKLKALSASKQIICITHIPLIAGLGDAQFFVSKEVDDGRTFATAKELGERERIEELARMLAGDRASRVTLEQARELLAQDTPKKARKKETSPSRCARSSIG
ncbi:MAG: DNA repair protein RecN [Candidatus Eisenbacteria bacterium]